MIGWRIAIVIAGLVMIAALLLGPSSATQAAGTEPVAPTWIDYKDSRYCEGCDLATQARSLGYVAVGARDPR
jgi:hypothetical protein